MSRSLNLMCECYLVGIFRFRRSATSVGASSSPAAASSLLRLLAPHVLQALSSRCVEYQTAGCMMLTQLCAQYTLESNVLNACLAALLQSVDGAAAAPATLAKLLLCVVTVCQSQPVSALPKKVLLALADCQNIAPGLNDQRKLSCDY